MTSASSSGDDDDDGSTEADEKRTRSAKKPRRISPSETEISAPQSGDAADAATSALNRRKSRAETKADKFNMHWSNMKTQIGRLLKDTDAHALCVAFSPGVHNAVVHATPTMVDLAKSQLLRWGVSAASMSSVDLLSITAQDLDTLLLEKLRIAPAVRNFPFEDSLFLGLECIPGILYYL